MLRNRRADQNLRARTNTVQAGADHHDDDEAAKKWVCRRSAMVESERTTSQVKLAGDWS
jgi:hypothetical protein